MKTNHGSGPGRGFRIFIWGAVALQFGFLSALLVLSVLMAPYNPNGQSSIVSTLIGNLSILVFPTVGVLIFTRRPNHPIGWLFCLSQTGWAVNNLANGFGLYAQWARPDLIPIAHWVIWFLAWPGFISIALFLLLILLFPDGALPTPRWKPLVRFIIIWAAICVVAAAFAPGPVDSSQVLRYDNPLGIGGPLGSLLQVVNQFGQFPLVPLFVLGGVSLVQRFRSASGQTRQQIKWLALAMVFVSVMVGFAFILLTVYPTAAVTPLWAQAFEQISILSLSLIPIAAGMAILRYRLYEIDRIINQALVYFSLTTALALVYFVSILVLQAALSAITGQGQSSVATVLSTLAMVGLFTPLRRRFQRVIDRRFYRQKYNTQLILDHFGAVLRSEVDLQVMGDQLLQVADEAIHPSAISLWITRRG